MKIWKHMSTNSMLKTVIMINIINTRFSLSPFYYQYTEWRPEIVYHISPFVLVISIGCEGDTCVGNFNRLWRRHKVHLTSPFLWSTPNLPDINWLRTIVIPFYASYTRTMPRRFQSWMENKQSLPRGQIMTFSYGHCLLAIDSPL